MRRTRSRLSPSPLFRGVIRPLLLLVTVGVAGIIVACQGPEPFHVDITVPGTGGTATGGKVGTGGRVATGGALATGGRATGGVIFGTGGVAAGGRATGGVIFATGGVAAGGRGTGGLVFGTGGMRVGGAAGPTGGTGMGGVSGGCTAAMEQVIVSAKVGATNGNSLALGLSVLNSGNVDIKLSGLKLRYYFKPTGTVAASGFIYEVDNITGNNKAVATSAVAATTPAPTTSTGADDYLEVSFTTTAPSLSPASTFQLEGRLHDKAYVATFTPAMDYSYVVSTTYVKAPKVVTNLVSVGSSCVLSGVPPS